MAGDSETRWVAVALAGALALALPLAAQEPPARSPRNASYEIEVTLDDEAKTLAGRQVLTWRNIRDQPTDELWFHLYWNGWRNDRSTWMLEDRLRGRSDQGQRVDDDAWSWQVVDSARLLTADGPAVDLTGTMRFESPDDGNPDDRTVLVVTLPEPVAPGETVRLEMAWRAKIPRTFARTGYRGKYFFIAHWFPKLGVYEEEGWNCHQYHAATEYYSDYGVYDVSITLPSYHIVGATGREIEQRDNGDGTTTHVYRQEDVHAYTWTASPLYVVYEETFEEPGLPKVEMRLLMQPEHRDQTQRHFAATRAALKYYGTWYGPYPYGHVTVIDPAYGSGAGGMEYPTIFTCGTRLFNPFGGDSPEGVTIHEAGHQFWYGIVGNNEFEYAWLDEGLNTFSTTRTLDVAYGDRILTRRFLSSPGRGRGRGGFFALTYPSVTVPRMASRIGGYRRSALSDDPQTPTFRYYPRTAGNISYSKTALWLDTLEHHLGWPVLQAILSTFFERYAFGHPTDEDFLAVADEVSGQDLSWFFDQVHRDSVTFDYAVTSVKSVPAEPQGFVRDGGELVLRNKPKRGDEEADADDKLYRTDVVVQRRGEGVFPVDVLLVFEDGSQVREGWNGEEHWKLFTVTRNSKLDYAMIDPDRVLSLDLSPTNNSRVREPDNELAARKWASKWMIWLQDLLQTTAFFM